MSTWYLGPYGDLRALDCPETGIELSVTRYGGVFQALSGARTVDVTGHRQAFNFSFEFLSAEDYAWLEALNLRHIRGPLTLINPLKKNRLSRLACSAAVGNTTTLPGISLSAGTATRVAGYPAGVLGSHHLSVASYGALAAFKFDPARPVPISASRIMRFSAYLKTATTQNVTMTIRYYTADGALLGSSGSAKAVTSTWTRFDQGLNVTGVPTAAYAIPELLFDLGGTYGAFQVAAPQFEDGSLTSWEMGSGAVRVLFDQQTTLSPLYPHRDSSISLLEA